MRLLYPTLFLVWAPWVLVPVVLYLFRPRPRTVRTTTLPFFKWLAREHQDSAWLRRLKHLLSLLVSILVILGAAGALARLVVSPPAHSVKTVVILVDRSASMAAKAEGGPSRLDEAVARAKHRLAGLPAGIGVIVMAYDQRPEVLLSRSMDRRKVQRALASIQVRPVEGDPATALRLASRLAALEAPASIWHATDALPDAQADLAREADHSQNSPEHGGQTNPTAAPVQSSDNPAQVAVEHLCVAMTEPVNVGITAFRLRRLPLERARFEAFVQVHCAAPAPVQAELDIELDGTLVAVRKLTLQPGGRQKLLIPVDAERDVDRILTLRVSADGDVLPSDNVVRARVPRLRPVRVLWVSESLDPFTELALSSLGAEADLEVLQGPPSAWPPKDAVDVAIFDGWLPNEWPADVPVIVINPAGSLGPVQAVRIRGGGFFLETLRATDEGHPLLYGVATGRVVLTQTAVLEGGGPLESVWVGSQGPVLLAGEAQGQRIVVMGFSPQHSEQLPLMASYPLLVGNAIYWAAENKIQSARGMNRRTGQFVELQGKSLTWDPVDSTAGKTTLQLEGRFTELDQIGLWETDAGQSGSASLLSADDTLIPAQQEDAVGTADAEDGTWALFRGDLVPILLWGVLILLIGESWLFHRYLAY